MAASRHWAVELHFQKGLAGAPAEVISTAARYADEPGCNRRVHAGDHRQRGAASFSRSCRSRAEPRRCAPRRRSDRRRPQPNCGRWRQRAALTSRRAVIFRPTGNGPIGARIIRGCSPSSNATILTACSLSATASAARTGARMDLSVWAGGRAFSDRAMSRRRSRPRTP